MEAGARGFVAGIVEGFYGPPWSTDRRREVLTEVAAWGMDHYVWAPKDDPKHRQRWREPYDGGELAVITALADTGLTIGWAIAPGLSIDVGDPGDVHALLAKVDHVVAAGISLVVLALDDLPVRPGLGPDHAGLTARLADHLAGRADVWLVPTEYTGCRSTAYLDALAAGVPEHVPIGWTGARVVNDVITAAQARARAAALGGRAPMLWDNHPVNDALMADRLFLGPLTGRDPGLREVCAGLLANPMLQARASLLPLASVAAWCRGDDPVAAWTAEAERRGWRTFADAVDGRVRPDHDGGDLDAWLAEAGACAAPGIEDEVGSWLEQVHLEVALCRRARALEHAASTGTDPERVVGLAVATVQAWQRARRSAVTVLGPRLSLRPAIDQDDAGRWRWHADAVEQSRNLTDALVARALETAAEARS